MVERVHRARALLAALPVGFAGLLVATCVEAQTINARGLRYDARVDLPITLGAAALLAGSDALKAWLVPSSCRVCDRHADGTDALNPLDAGIRAAFRWNDTDAANTASNLTGFSIAPVFSLGVCEAAAAVDNRSREAPANALIVLEATALAATLDQALKFAVARERPFAHFRVPAGAGARDSDDHLSFYSGHTSLAFSLAVASGTVASMRGYRLAPAVWASALPVAVLTGYLRMAADAHYFTDVLVGAVLGSAVGFLVPFAFHRAPSSPADSTTPGRTTLAAVAAPLVAGSWTF